MHHFDTPSFAKLSFCMYKTYVFLHIKSGINIRKYLRSSVFL